MKNLKMILLSLCALGLQQAHAQTEATYYTTKGSFKVVLTDTLTPITVDSFIARVSEKFYDGLIFHRVINNFMIQGGDPLGTGMGGPGYTIPDEFHSTLKNVPKALAMANAGPNTGGSQFFINLVTNSHLDNRHTVFGMVTTNFTVVQTIGAVPTGAGDRPVTDVVMDSIRITRVYPPPAAVGSTANTLAANIFPNPSRGTFSISLPTTTTKVAITNMAGAVVYSTQASGKLNIDFTKHPTGLYIVHLTNTTGTTSSRLIVQ